MITVDPDKSKVLEFNINITGNKSQPVARLVMPLEENVNLSILGSFHENAIKVILPKLRPYYEQLMEGTAQLEIIVDGNVFTPWSDKIKFKEQLKVVAEMVSYDEVEDSGIQVSLVSETVETEPIVVAPVKKALRKIPKVIEKKEPIVDKGPTKLRSFMVEEDEEEE